MDNIQRLEEQEGIQMNNTDAIEQAYRNGYEDGKRDAVKRGTWRLGKSGCMYFCPFCGFTAHPRERDEWIFCPRCGSICEEIFMIKNLKMNNCEFKMNNGG